MKKITILLLFIPLFFTNCSKDEDETQLIINELPDFSVVNISRETNWDLMVLDKNDYYFIKTNLINNTTPKSALFHSSAVNKDFSLFFDDNGLIDKVVVNDYIFVFGNFNGEKVDIGIINPSGETEILREVETGYDWDGLNKLVNKKGSSNEVVRWTSHAIRGLGCAFSVASATATFGLGSVLAGITCANFAVRLADDIFEWGLDEYLDTFEGATVAFSCATLQHDCIMGASSLAFDELTDDTTELENVTGPLEFIRSALDNGYFKSAYFDFNDNQVPEGWEFLSTGSPGSDISNGRMNAYVTDGRGDLTKTAQVSNATSEIVLEMDANFVYSYWGNKGMFNLHFGDKILQFRAGEEDYDHPEGVSANEVYYYDGTSGYFIHEETSPIIYGVYHLKLTMNESSYEFVGIDPNGDEAFRINIDPDSYFDFKDIDQLKFIIVSTTNNSSWIDNLRITVVE